MHRGSGLSVVKKKGKTLFSCAHHPLASALLLGSVSLGFLVTQAGRPVDSRGANREAQAGVGRLVCGPEPGHHRGPL